MKITARYSFTVFKSFPIAGIIGSNKTAPHSGIRNNEAQRIKNLPFSRRLGIFTDMNKVKGFFVKIREWFSYEFETAFDDEPNNSMTYDTGSHSLKKYFIKTLLMLYYLLVIYLIILAISFFFGLINSSIFSDKINPLY